MKHKPTQPLPPEPAAWDLSESFGVIPQDLSLSHNLGCVRSPKPKKETKKSQLDAPNPTK
ncbi:MAG: hypothetical protein ACK5BR_09260 [Bacteroidota bacterium]